MTRVLKPPSFPIWNTLIAFSIAACLLQSQASAQTNNARSLLMQYEREVARVLQAAGKLGPYTITSDCTLKNHNKIRWSNTADFRNSLSVLWRAEQNVETFSTCFAPAQAWIDRLPQFKQQFDGNADRVLGVQQDIKAGIGPTDQQRQIVAQALQNLTGILDSSSRQLHPGTAALADFLQRLSQYRPGMAQAIAGFDQSSQVELNRLMSRASQSPFAECDTSDFRSSIEVQFNSIKGQVYIASKEMSQASQNLDTSSRAAEKAVAELLAFVVNNQTDIGSVRDMVNAASNDQIGSFLQRLHLDAAKNRLALLAQ